MEIKRMIDDIEEGQLFDIRTRVKIGKYDVLALKLLKYLYEITDDDFIFGDADRVISEMLYWHITFSVIIDNFEKNVRFNVPICSLHTFSVSKDTPQEEIAANLLRVTGVRWVAVEDEIKY